MGIRFENHGGATMKPDESLQERIRQRAYIETAMGKKAQPWQRRLLHALLETVKPKKPKDAEPK
jgi:hypothetical protein